MARGRHIKRARSAVVVVAIAVGIVLLALGGVSFAAYRYDRASADRILPGVTVAGTDVGGMTRAEAIQAVQHAVQDSGSRRPITVRAADGRGRPHLRSSAVRRCRRRRSIKRSRHRTPWGSSRGSGIVSARSPSTSRSTSRSSAAGPASQRSGVEHRRRRGPDAARRLGGRRRRQVTFVHSRPGHALGAHVGDEATAGGARGRLDRRPVAGQDRQAQGPGREDRQDDRRRPDHQPALLYNGFDLEKHVSRRHGRRGLRHAARGVDDHRQAGEPDLDEPGAGHVGSRPAGVHPPRPGQPAGNPRALPECSRDPDPRHGRRRARSARTPRTAASGC